MFSVDDVIAGTGLSGAVLTNRPNTKSEVSVCPINAGPEDRRPLDTIPLASIWLFQSTLGHHTSNVIPKDDVQPDEQILTYTPNQTRTPNHTGKTCAMDTGPIAAVINQCLRVHGIRRLRVVDASTMPKIVSANTHAPAIVIAEQAAEMIAEDRRTSA